MAQPRAPVGTATSVVIAHESAAGRYALRMLFDAEPDFAVMGETAWAGEAGRLARAHRVAVLVLYERLLVDGTIGVLPTSCAVVILGLEDHPAAAAAPCARGANDYVVWDRAADDLLPVVRRLVAQPLPAIGA